MLWKVDDILMVCRNIMRLASKNHFNKRFLELEILQWMPLMSHDIL